MQDSAIALVEALFHLILRQIHPPSTIVSLAGGYPPVAFSNRSTEVSLRAPGPLCWHAHDYQAAQNQPKQMVISARPVLRCAQLIPKSSEYQHGPQIPLLTHVFGGRTRYRRKGRLGPN